MANDVINGATIKVTLLINNKRIEELRKEGVSDKSIEKMIRNSITLRDIPFRDPVIEIEYAELLKYY